MISLLQVIFIAAPCFIFGFLICYLFWFLPADIAAGRMSKEEKRNRILMKMYMRHRL